MSFPHAGLGQAITNWIAERALSRTLRHVDDHLLRDLGLYDEGHRAIRDSGSRVFDRYL